MTEVSQNSERVAGELSVRKVASLRRDIAALKNELSDTRLLVKGLQEDLASSIKLQDDLFYALRNLFAAAEKREAERETVLSK